MENKDNTFSTEIIELANVAKALSHPARIKIMQILGEKNACICGDLVELLPLSQSTVSQHLKELKKAELIIGEVEGPKTCYCLNKNTLVKVKICFENLFTSINCC